MSLRIITFGFLGLYSLLAILHAWSLPFSADEAHYALYGSFLDWSYFDHPPMVGWLQSIALSFSESEFSLRVIPIILSGLSLYVLFHLAKKDFGENTALLTILLFISAPILQILPFGMIPETPLILTGLLNIWVLKKIQTNNGHQVKYWLLLGIILGVAGLSKYTGVTLAVSTFLVLYLQFKTRLFSQIGFYLAGMIAAICILPVLYWNMQNDWISFLYQLDHSAGKSEFSLVAALRMQVTQLAAFGPLIYILGIIAIWKLRASNEAKTWLFFALPILILFSILSAKGRSLPHWTELGVIFMLPLIAQVIILSAGNKIQKRIFIGLASLSLLLTLVVQILITYPKIAFDDYRHPLADLMGWKEASSRIITLAQTGDKVFIPNWSHASRVAWYARPMPVKVLDSRFDQFDLWFGSAAVGDSGILLLHADRKGFKEKLLKQFLRCELKDELKVKIDSSYVNYFKLYRCDHYMGSDN
ncbi:MAG: 4-amino-4-deoxy-L-arabinose transferase-like glycosyltransferase [Oleispira sp.]|jgi:4-amino-4-deoxy-L-arabinose transferase-like glycosyltransferase